MIGHRYIWKRFKVIGSVNKINKQLSRSLMLNFCWALKDFV